MRVLVVGNNPSLRSPDPTVPFAGTRSGTTLTRWLESLSLPDGTELHLVNISHRPSKTVAESSFTSGEVSVVALFAKSCDAVLALGRKVGRALTKAGVKHHEMPHPSGLNRKLNDPRFVDYQLRQCEEYLRMRAEGAGRRPDEQDRLGPPGPTHRRARAGRDRTRVREESTGDQVQPGEGGQAYAGGSVADREEAGEAV